MKTGLALLASYFVLTPLFIFTLVFYQLFLHHPSDIPQKGKVLSAKDVKIVGEAKAFEIEEIAAEIEKPDIRVDLLRNFFHRYDSPLFNHAEEIVMAADKYGLDYRLVPAIAMQESTLCLKAPKDTNNCWGFGIYGSKRTAFEDYSQAILAVSKTLSEKYHANGLREPAEIMSKYTPSNDGEWAANVSYVMSRIGGVH